MMIMSIIQVLVGDKTISLMGELKNMALPLLKSNQAKFLSFKNTCVNDMSTQTWGQLFKKQACNLYLSIWGGFISLPLQWMLHTGLFAIPPSYLLLPHSPSMSQRSHVCFHVPKFAAVSCCEMHNSSPTRRGHDPSDNRGLSFGADFTAFHISKLSKQSVLFRPAPSEDEPAGQAREMTLSASHWASSSSNKT